jgi:iron complex outermembrane receptor protein
VRGLSLQSGLTYAKTEYGDSRSPTTRPTPWPCCRAARCRWRRNGLASGSLTYEHPVGDGLKARFNIGAKYSSDYNTGSDLFPPKVQKDFTVVNARIALGAQDDKWTVELWARTCSTRSTLRSPSTASCRAPRA